ncbi:PKD domain-containing protein [Fulvivirga lutimaris]|uniref:PKD domain-containing protein n=1 Tax=Fulvivirga lutimaris TaxID=1819566 RepID=UPI0012BC6928|nr:PKD domain-containing protein [Fulvivirga lutimaris]MTI40653.1 PKD domain-containing protein [Fulvivirga lutimaris]
MKNLISKISAYALYIAVILTVTQACSSEEDSEPVPAPSASFTSSTTSIKEGEQVTFTNTSKDEETILWSFPGGSPSTSTSESPTVTYSTAGRFDVVLTVVNSSGSDTETKTELIKVEALDTEGPSVTNISPSSNASGIALNTNIVVTFSEAVDVNSVNNTSVILSGGASNSIAANVSISGTTMTIDPNNDLDYNTEYSLILSQLKDLIGNPMSSTFSSKFTTEQAPPEANFSFSVNGFQVTFTNTSSNGNSYSWDFGDGTTSAEENPTKTYSVNGTYTVTLTANGNGSDQMSKDVEIAVALNLPDFFTNKWYNVAGTWIYGIDSDTQGKYVRTGNKFYYYDPFKDVSKQVISGKDVYEVVGTSSESTKTFWIKARGSAGNNILDISQTSATSGFTEYGSVVGRNVKYAKFDNGNYVEYVGSSTWEERQPNGTLVASFTENLRDDWSTYLTKNGTGESFSIDVFKYKFKINGNDLYTIVEATP